MNEIYYSIAGITIKVESPFPFQVRNAVNFVCEKQEPDYIFRFCHTDNIPKVLGGSVQVADVIWAHEFRKSDGSYQRAFLWQDVYYIAVSELGKKEGICYYASDHILLEKASEGFELLMYLCIEQILLEYGCLVLHSSHVNVDGKGLVFSAPCQTGKSTQAELWRQYAGATVLNGDRSVLRKEGNVWYVYGCPMCGTSGIHLQGKEELTNIVMLSKARENRARKIQGMEAFRMIYPQITVSGWNRTYVDRVIELLNELLTDVPVWQYACTKEPEAVTELRRVLGWETI